MNAGHSARRIAASASPLARDTICISCRHRLTTSSRRYAATAAAAVESSTPPQPPPSSSKSNHVPPVSTTSAIQKAYAVLAAPVLSRPPLLTRELSSFEKAYYLYQKRLNERLALPFSRYFYYKKGTPGDEDWKRKVKSRKAAAKDIGAYSGYGEEAWNDEVLVGSKLAEPTEIVKALIKDAEGKSVVEDEAEAEKAEKKSQEEVAKEEMNKITVEKPMSRLTEADTTNNTKSLNRKLDQSLYLLIKNKDGRWRFPEDRVYGRENLHQAAERILVQSCGINMNTWLVGNHPIGHYSYTFPPPSKKNALPAGPNGGRLSTVQPNAMVPTSLTTGPKDVEEFGEKLFFMKGRIMAGQVELAKNEYGDQDFAWLSKDEIQKYVTERYWSSVRNMLADR